MAATDEYRSVLIQIANSIAVSSRDSEAGRLRRFRVAYRSSRRVSRDVGTLGVSRPWKDAACGL